MLNRIPLKAGLPAALAAVCLVTVIFKEVAAVNATTVGFAYLITILLIAAWAGIAESVLASIAATFCFNYFFLPPVGTWVISDPQNWVALFAFLMTALIASELSRRARRRRMEMERLYSLSRSIMMMDDSVSADLPRVFIDGDLVQLALRQLVDNALKYSLRGTSIQISSRLADHDFLISVHNQGEPLSESERTRVFDKFYRGENVRHQVAGTGMGLPVAREILLAHDGDLVLESSDEDGTEFVMTIPATAM